MSIGPVIGIENVTVVENLPEEQRNAGGRINVKIVGIDPNLQRQI